MIPIQGGRHDIVLIIRFMIINYHIKYDFINHMSGLGNNDLGLFCRLIYF